MKLTILGSSCMIPTKKRNHSAYFLTYKNEGILFDCGEGTQRQFKFANIKPTKITKLIISHWHGDHVLGIPGLLETLSASEYSKTLEIYGPPETLKKIKLLNKVFESYKNIKYKIIEIKKEGLFFENETFKLEAYKLDHSIISFGFRFIEKDKRRINMTKIKKYGLSEGPLLGRLQKGENIKFNQKIIQSNDVTNVIKGKIFSYISDTAFCNNCLVVAKNSDLLLCESTYLSSEIKKAKEYKHLTSKEAGFIAKETKCKKLILTHFSQRYKNNLKLLKDAKNEFENVICAKDLLSIKI